MSAPSVGTLGTPGSVTAITGHGFGLHWQKLAKSAAMSLGRTTRFPCTNPGARPAVGPVSVPALAASRTSRPCMMAYLVAWRSITSSVKDPGIIGGRRRGFAAVDSAGVGPNLAPTTKT
jgi:hypothetical protein